MTLGRNRFKRALREGRQQIGLWSTLSTGYSAEVVAGAGFDWLLLDTEHSPADVLTVLAQLQALAGFAISPVVRPAVNDTVLIKRYLDIGAQTLLIPFVQDAEEARTAVAAIRYPPAGARGVSAMTRANQFGRIGDYPTVAETELCLLVQVESRRALDNIEAIAAVEGVDGIFIGPGDLAADLGHIGRIDHPDVLAAVDAAIVRIAATGKAPGILAGSAALAERWIELGTRFTAVGTDAAILARGADALAERFGRR